MAISPDDIVQDQEKPCTEKELEQVDRLEQVIDPFLQVNYYSFGYCNFFIREDCSKPVVYELARRYRAAGWNIHFCPDPDHGFSRPAISFTREGCIEDGIIKLEGVPNF